MSGEAQYYNPIIEAMTNSAQLAQQRARQLEDAKQHTENLKLRQQHQDAQEKQDQAEEKRKVRDQELKEEQNKREHEDHRQKLEVAHRVAQAAVDAREIMMRENVAKGMASGIKKEAYQDPGVDKTSYLPGLIPNMGQTPANMVRIGDKDIPADAFPTPESEIKRQGDLALAKAKGGAEGKAPSQMQVDDNRAGNQQTLAGINNKSRSDITDKLIKSREKIAFLQDATKRFTSNAALKAHGEMGGDLSGFNVDDVSNVVNDLYLTGTDTINTIPSKLRVGVKNSVPKGWTLIEKTDKPKLDAAESINKIINDSEELAPYSGMNDNVLKTIAGQAGFGHAGAVKDRLTGEAGKLARVFSDEKGVLTNPDIERALKLIYSPLRGEAENRANVAELRDLYKKIMKPVVSKYAPDQLNAILSKRGIDPSVVIDESQGLGGSKSSNKLAPTGQKTEKVEEWKRVNGKLVKVQ